MADRSDKRLDSRLEQARQYFRQHHAEVEPDAGFAARVGARLESNAPDLLGWAALRLLPATLALVALLAWFSLQTGKTAEQVYVDTVTDDLLSWVLGDSENGS